MKAQHEVVIYITTLRDYSWIFNHTKENDKIFQTQTPYLFHKRCHRFNFIIEERW